MIQQDNQDLIEKFGPNRILSDKEFLRLCLTKGYITKDADRQILILDGRNETFKSITDDNMRTKLTNLFRNKGNKVDEIMWTLSYNTLGGKLRHRKNRSRSRSRRRNKSKRINRRIHKSKRRAYQEKNI